MKTLLTYPFTKKAKIKFELCKQVIFNEKYDSIHHFYASHNAANVYTNQY